MVPPRIHSVLIVGAGSIGERHLRCFLQTGRVSIGVCEVNDSLRETVAERHGIKRSVKTFDAAVADDWDAVVIATPAPIHIPLALKAVNRGLHLLIEKPLSISFEGVAELTQAVAQRKVTAAVAYVQRCNPALFEARRAIVDGRFGKPLQVVTVSGQNFPFYRPAYRDTYYAQRSSGGGAIQDALTHFLNSVQWLIGPADRVMADAAHLAVPNVDVEDTVHVIAQHGSVLAAYALNQHQAPNESTISIICERGTVRITLHNNRWAHVDTPQKQWTEYSFDELQRDDLFTRQANGFLDAIEGVADPLCSLAEGVSTLQTNLAIIEASESPVWTRIRNT
jgi:predicted dehydrogenase